MEKYFSQIKCASVHVNQLLRPIFKSKFLKHVYQKSLKKGPLLFFQVHVHEQFIFFRCSSAQGFVIPQKHPGIRGPRQITFIDNRNNSL